MAPPSVVLMQHLLEFLRIKIWYYNFVEANLQLDIKLLNSQDEQVPISIPTDAHH